MDHPLYDEYITMTNTRLEEIAKELDLSGHTVEKRELACRLVGYSSWAKLRRIGGRWTCRRHSELQRERPRPRPPPYPLGRPRSPQVRRAEALDHEP